MVLSPSLLGLVLNDLSDIKLLMQERIHHGMHKFMWSIRDPSFCQCYMKLFIICMPVLPCLTLCVTELNQLRWWMKVGCWGLHPLERIIWDAKSDFWLWCLLEMTGRAWSTLSTAVLRSIAKTVESFITLGRAVSVQWKALQLDWNFKTYSI